MKETTVSRYLPTLNTMGRKRNNVKNEKNSQLFIRSRVKPKIVYNSAKISQYFNVKDPVPKKDKSDLVY